MIITRRLRARVYENVCGYIIIEDGCNYGLEYACTFRQQLG